VSSPHTSLIPPPSSALPPPPLSLSFLCLYSPFPWTVSPSILPYLPTVLLKLCPRSGSSTLLILLSLCLLIKSCSSVFVVRASSLSQLHVVCLFTVWLTAYPQTSMISLHFCLYSNFSVSTQTPLSLFKILCLSSKSAISY
jgi:hypothetical protein